MVKISNEFKEKWKKLVDKSLGEETIFDEDLIIDINSKKVKLPFKGHPINKIQIEIPSNLNLTRSEIDFLVKKIRLKIAEKQMSELVIEIVNDDKIRENDLSKPDCGISYEKSSPELNLWELGLLCQYWTLYLLKRKEIEGHCHKKNKREYCSEGAEFHRNLYNEALKSFRELTNNDYNIEVSNDLESEK